MCLASTLRPQYGIEPIPIERALGRKIYIERQQLLMERARPVRRALLDAYDAFLLEAYDEAALELAAASPSPERFATATPGGAPWRRSLYEPPVPSS